MNYKPVSHLDHAIGYLDASRTVQDGLREAYASDLAQERDPKRINSLHQAINYGLKAGEVSALIGIGKQLEQLVDLLNRSVEDAPRSSTERTIYTGAAL